jgi:hypothetical protein
MPRQIIDTESSRPAYVRRRIFTTIAYVVGGAVLAVAVWALWLRSAVHPGH